MRRSMWAVALVAGVFFFGSNGAQAQTKSYDEPIIASYDPILALDHPSAAFGNLPWAYGPVISLAASLRSMQSALGAFQHAAASTSRKSSQTLSAEQRALLQRTMRGHLRIALAQHGKAVAALRKQGHAALALKLAGLRPALLAESRLWAASSKHGLKPTGARIHKLGSQITEIGKNTTANFEAQVVAGVLATRLAGIERLLSKRRACRGCWLAAERMALALPKLGVSAVAVKRLVVTLKRGGSATRLSVSLVALHDARRQLKAIGGVLRASHK